MHYSHCLFCTSKDGALYLCSPNSWPTAQAIIAHVCPQWQRQRGQQGTSPCPGLCLRKSKSAWKPSLCVSDGWLGLAVLILPLPVPSLKSPLIYPYPTPLKVQYHVQIQQAAAQSTVSLGVWSAVKPVAMRERGKLIALSQQAKNVSCIKGAANGGFFRFSHLLLFASKADTDRNDKILQHWGDSPKQLLLPVLIWASKYKSQPSLISARYSALWSYLCLNSLFYMNSYVSLKLQHRHTEADYKNKFNIFRTILQHLNECHGVACVQQNVKLSQPPMDTVASKQPTRSNPWPLLPLKPGLG